MNKSIISLITNHLSRPVEVTPDIRGFAESSLGLSSPGELFDFLTTDEAHDSGIQELLIFPPESLREALEEHLPPSGIDTAELNVMAEAVLKEVKSISLVEPESGTTGALTPGISMILELFTSLRLSTAIPMHFTPERGSDPGIFPGMRSLLRRHWHRLTEPAREHLLRIARDITEEETSPEDTATLINTTATVLGGLLDGEDPYEVLSRRKQEYEKLTDAITNFEDMQKRYSMDILMSMRLTPPPENYHDLMEKIIILDRISRILFEIPARGRAPEQNISMDMKKIDFEKLI